MLSLVIVFVICYFFFFFFKQKTAYEMRISDWSSDVCSSDLNLLSFMRQLRLVFRMVGARANKDSELLAPTRLGLLQSNHVRMPSPRFSSKAALKRRMRKPAKLSSSN